MPDRALNTPLESLLSCHVFIKLLTNQEYLSLKIQRSLRAVPLKWFLLVVRFLFYFTTVIDIFQKTRQLFINSLRIHCSFSTILKTNNKSVWSYVFWYVKVYVFWKFIQYTIHGDKTQILKKFPSDKINSTKNALIFLSRAPTLHSFTFNLRFLNELKHKIRLSETVCGIFHFRFRFVFVKVYIFVQQNAWTLWL